MTAAGVAVAGADAIEAPAALASALLQRDWTKLCSPVRAVHSRRPIVLEGVASIVRGRGLLARALGALARLPRAQTDGPVRVQLMRTSDGHAERWTRWFGESAPMCSALRLVTARDGEPLLEERLGLARMRFRHTIEGGAIRWTCVGASTLGVPWPRAWCDGIEASESERAGDYFFNVRASLPGIGFLVHYVGALRVER